VSQLVFYGAVIYQTDPTGYSWILYHEEYSVLCAFFGVLASVFFVYGWLKDMIEESEAKRKEEGWED
jgi:hypothetical protein